MKSSHNSGFNDIPPAGERLLGCDRRSIQAPWATPPPLGHPTLGIVPKVPPAARCRGAGWGTTEIPPGCYKYW